MSQTPSPFSRLWRVLVLLMIFGAAAGFTITADTWWHLRAGQWIWQHHRLPGADPFSYTLQGAVWHYPGWPAELLMYALVRVGGLGALNIAVALTITSTWWVVWRTMRPQHEEISNGSVIVLAALASGVYWGARPYLVTFFLSAVFLWLLAREKQRPGHAVWWLPVLMVVWVNSHGAFVMGLVWWGVYWLAAGLRWLWSRSVLQQPPPPQTLRAWKKLTLLGVALLVAALLNPYGAEMLAYPFKTVKIHSLYHIAEWRSPDFHQPALLPFLALLLATLLSLGASSTPLTAEEAFLLAGSVFLALGAVRNVALAAVVLAPIVARHTAAWLEALRAARPRPQQRAPAVHPRLNLALVALVAFFALGRAGVMATPQVNRIEVARAFPVAAVQTLESRHPQGRLFNDYNWGGYLLWAAPDYPVFIDGRTDLYGDTLIRQWARIMAAEPGWEALLDQWHVRVVLIRRDAPLAQRLPARGWRLLYQDARSVLYAR